MKKNQILALSIATLAVFSCKTTEKTHHKTEKHASHWSYKGKEKPENWSHISEQYKDCEGSAQSPINLVDSQVIKGKNSLSIHYVNTGVHIVNNGHTEQFNIDKGSIVTLNGKTYALKQFHMHTLSEHTVNGKHYPLEIHFVNKAKDGTYAVIGVFVEEGEASEFLNKYLNKLPSKEGNFNADESFEIRNLIPFSKHYYHYKGSFTTPPCTEIVDWVILKEHLTASKAQLDQLHHLMHNNYRPIQKLNGRLEEAQ